MHDGFAHSQIQNGGRHLGNNYGRAVSTGGAGGFIFVGVILNDIFLRFEGGKIRCIFTVVVAQSIVAA